MDRVRLGRALGVGARNAAKTLIEAVDAATSPDPSSSGRSSTSSARSQPAPQRPASPPATLNGLTEGGRRFAESFSGRFKRLGSALWHEFTGVFFGIFVLYGASGIWKYRDGLHSANHDVRTHLLMATGMTLVFGYFCVSSFVRASHRNRGPAKRR